MPASVAQLDARPFVFLRLQTCMPASVAQLDARPSGLIPYNAD